MRQKLPFAVLVAVAALVVGVGSASAVPTPGPSGERLVGGHLVNGNLMGGTVIEPAIDDMTGAIRYISTPRGAPDPVKSNPVASAPIYLPIYPTSSTVPGSVTLVCQDVPQENCPDHGPALAGIAQGLEPGVYGGGVAGHDHLLAGPASHGDFNVAWVPVVVLFTNSAAANTHITTEAQIESMQKSGDIIEIRLDGSDPMVPVNLTFTCAVVNAAVYARGIPYNPPA